MASSSCEVAAITEGVESREDLKSMLPFLPLVIRSSSLVWPSRVVEVLKAISKGPDYSNINSGESLFTAISDIRNSLYLSDEPLAPFAQEGYSLFFDEELISALLACAFFCLFPVTNRGAKHLPTINLDHLFEEEIVGSNVLQEMVKKVEHEYGCCLVHNSGFIEDQSNGALEVDFANKYLGGGALHRGCVQEEIRFMINPELIAGLLFLPHMEDNEAIEIVGAERFSNYTGYASSFRFSGDHVDRRNVDSFGRHKTRIVAIDALSNPGMRQYKINYLLREINKAFCGFSDLAKYDHYKRLFQNSGPQGADSEEHYKYGNVLSMNNFLVRGSNDLIEDSGEKSTWCLDHKDKIGIATGNWGCGAFGGDPELKTIIQWLAASQALRPSIFYYTFGIEALSNLDQGGEFRSRGVRVSRAVETLRSDDGKKKRWEESCDTDEDDDGSSARKGQGDDPYLMDPEERREWRRKIKDVIDKYPDVEEQLDHEEKKLKMQKLLDDYPLVVEEDDPDWPEDADGWGFNLGQFFNKITIKNVKKDVDDENYDSENEIVWQDDNYIRPIKDITTTQWEETVFKDISPLIVLVHNRYKRSKENEKIRDELEKAVHIIWNCRLPSPRCVAIDAVVETDLVCALKVSIFPEIIFTKAGKILYREKAMRTADEFSKIMAYFYYGAGKPPCLNDIEDSQELIPSVSLADKNAKIIDVQPLQ
ncbi:hypothetical protein GH714_031566 [Hevea brasiliensis]|uniref:Uncharacterized protein n=1 Tax=Hevea brasiliensis TaxID=3981 RepID=A0A6A6NK59_HEVBR|nr:hypothetical protein GH714_031566 [Hevea brasiliensis]